MHTSITNTRFFMRKDIRGCARGSTRFYNVVIIFVFTQTIDNSYTILIEELHKLPV